MEEDSPQAEDVPRDGKQTIARRRLTLLAAAMAGGLFAIVAVVVTYAVFNRETASQVTAELVQQASDRWDTHGPQNYDLEVALTKRRVERHRVEVRRGEVVRYTLDDHEMTRRRSFDTWSVPGMFGTIEADVENVRLVETGEAQAYTPRLSLWGTFDEEFGIPRRYRRVQWGADFEVSWDVVEFKIINE